MGFGSNGSKTIYNVSGISRADVIDIGNDILRKSNPESASSARPTTVIDAHNVVYKVGRNSINPVYEVANHLLEWAQQGMIMVPICDGETRPVAKQASNKKTCKKSEE